MSYLKSPFQIYVHCRNDGCECHRDARNFLHSWGIEASFGYDGDHYLEFTVPQGWSQDKIKKFSDALSKKLKIVEASPDLYQALVHVPTGDLSSEDIFDAYLRATCVAAGIRFDPAFMDRITKLFHQQRAKTNDA